MAEFTYAAVMALIQIIDRAGLEQVWPDFLRAYGIRDIGTEPPSRPRAGYGDQVGDERLYRIKAAGRRLPHPEVETFFEQLTQAVYQELVRPSLDRFGKAGYFFDDDQAAGRDLDRLLRELNREGYHFDDEGRLISEDAAASAGDVDGVTGIGTRQYLDRESERIMEQCRANGLPCAAIFLDVDDFKRFNEQFDHATGDQVLRGVAEAATAAVKFKGALGRYGAGDEIVATLRNMTENEAAGIAERIRSAVAGFSIRGAAVTISAGVASVTGSGSVKELWDMADRALLHSKTLGKDRVTRFSESPPGSL